jgi:hypothetical protein
MFDQITANVMNILSLSIGGISIGSIIAMVIYVTHSIIKNRKDIKITKEYIEQAFQNAVLPSTIKLDVSSKIALPIKEGLAQIADVLNTTLLQIKEGIKYNLEILEQFSHVQKLPAEEQQKIKEYLNSSDETVKEVEL